MVGPRRPAGFTLVELLVATTVTLVALGLAVALLHPPSVAFQALPEALDAQQRVRVAVQTLAAGINGAGAGPALGWAARVPPSWPGVLPCRFTGEPLGSVAGGCARDDAITVMAMGLAAPQAILLEPVAAQGTGIRVGALSACALSLPVCRMHAGSRALVADGTGAWDVFNIAAVSPDGTLVAHAAGALTWLYPDGALVGEIETAAYSLRVDPTSHVPQLRRATNGSSDMPMIDDVTSLRFEYFGEAGVPQVLDDGDAERRRTTYGPLPPPAGIDHPPDAWTAGENCLFSRDQGQPSPRLAVLPSEESGLARLPLSMFTDGPWCPDDTSPNRYDADLLRVRLVRVTLRAQAQSAAVRGADPRLFSHPGAAREAARLVPDLEVRVDVALRNGRR